MAIYQKHVSIGGKWVKATDIAPGTKAKLVSETVNQPSSFTKPDGTIRTQDVAKISIQGNPEPMNISINRASINALVEAFGEDSKSWIGKVLTLDTEKQKVAGKTVLSLYLVPEGYEKTDDENGYTVVVAKDFLESMNPPPAAPEEVSDIAAEDLW